MAISRKFLLRFALERKGGILQKKKGFRLHSSRLLLDMYASGRANHVTSDAITYWRGAKHLFLRSRFYGNSLRCPFPLVPVLVQEICVLCIWNCITGSPEHVTRYDPPLEPSGCYTYHQPWHYNASCCHSLLICYTSVLQQINFTSRCSIVWK